LANVPVPFEVQAIPALFVELEPAVMFTAPKGKQVLIVGPETAVGAEVIVSVFVDVAFAHPACATAVSVSVTLPAEISAALGLYVQVVKEVEFANDPVPLLVQFILVWLVALAPAVILTAPLDEHVETGEPATDVGGWLKFMVLLEVAFAQGEFPFAVKVRVLLPAAISAALGV